MGKTWYDFQVLMRERCCLHRLTSATAGSFGYGGNARGATEDAAFKGMVANVGAAQAANQGVVQTLVQRNNAQAISIAQMQQQIAALAVGGPLPSTQPAQYQQQWQQLYQQQYPPLPAVSNDTDKEPGTATVVAAVTKATVTQDVAEAAVVGRAISSPELAG